MLRPSSYATNALPYGWLSQLFTSPVKAAVQNAGQISTLLQFSSLGSSNSELTQFLHAVAQRPPVVTVYRFADGLNPSSGISFVSPNAPVFDASV